MELAPVQRQLADVEILAGDHQRPRGGGHDDAGLIKPLHVLYAGDGELFPADQLQAVARLGHGIVVVVHSASLPCPNYMGPGGRLCVPRHRPISRYRAPASAWRTVSWTSSTSTVTVRWPKRREI